MLGAALLFSAMAVCVKAGGERLPVVQLVFARLAVTLVLSLVAIRRLGLSPLGVDRRRLLLRALSGLLGLGCFFYALDNLPLADAKAIQFSSPVFTALLAAMMLRERIGPTEAAGIALSIIGVVAVARPAFLFGSSVDPLDPVATGVAVVGALAAAVAYVTVRRLRATDQPLVIVGIFPIVGFPLILPFAIYYWVWPTPLEWALMLGIGVSTQAAQVLMTRALHLAPAGVAMAVGYVQIVLGFVWGVALFAEPVHAMSLLGAVLIMGGTTLTSARAAGLFRRKVAASKETPE
ncbi:MAG: drug/metabolite transporter (DMT)-like permease [Bradymonadia bacterium]|jgi:drug/metabolite transporter (DMT)-like permease